MKGLALKILVFMIVMLCIDHALAAFLKAGLLRYDNLDKRAEVLCVGNSHTVMGVDANRLEKELHVPVAKYARHGASMSDRLVMLRNYFEQQPNPPKVVVYDVDAATFDKWSYSRNSFVRFYPYLDSETVESYLRDNGASWKEIASRKIFKLLRYNDPWLIRSAVKGHIGSPEPVSAERINPSKVQAAVFAAKKAAFVPDPESVRCFDATVKLIKAHRAKVVLLYIPTIDSYNDGIDLKYREVARLFDRYAQSHDGVFFLDYSHRYQSRHDLFYDLTHVNRKGEALVTDDLSADLKALLSPPPAQY